MGLENPGALRRPGQERNATVTRKELEQLYEEMNDFKRKTRSILTEILKLVDRLEDLHRSYPGTCINITDLLRQIEKI